MVHSAKVLLCKGQWLGIDCVVRLLIGQLLVSHVVNVLLCRAIVGQFLIVSDLGSPFSLSETFGFFTLLSFLSDLLASFELLILDYVAHHTELLVHSHTADDVFDVALTHLFQNH